MRMFLSPKEESSTSSAANKYKIQNKHKGLTVIRGTSSFAKRESACGHTKILSNIHLLRRSNRNTHDGKLEDVFPLSPSLMSVHKTGFSSQLCT